MTMKLTRQYFPVKEVTEGPKCKYENGLLTLNYEELLALTAPHMATIKGIQFEVARPGESARIIHIYDTIQPMYKSEIDPTLLGGEYPGVLNDPFTVGQGTTNLLDRFSVMECAAIPWEESNASSGLLYARDAIVEMSGPYKGFTPFSETINLVMVFDVFPGKSSEEYDNDMRKCTIKVATFLASLTKDQEPERTEVFNNTPKEGLPNVALVWQCQNQGVYTNTLLYGLPIYDIVPTLLEPNEMLDGCVVGGNYAWPTFKVPTYIHVNHPILLDLYRRHGVELNFVGVIFCRSHQPSHWHKERCSQMCAKIADTIHADGIVMAWEGGGNAAVDGMLTIQHSERRNIKGSLITFEFGGKDGTEGQLLVDDVPEADAVISGGSWERPIILEKVEKAYGGDFLRLDKDTGGFFPPATDAITFTTNIQMYMGANQSGYSKWTAHEY